MELGSRGWLTSWATLLSLAAAVFVGLLLRTVEFASDRSTWFDEAKLGLNIFTRGGARLFAPLDFSQAAPPGFLFLERLDVSVMGGLSGLRLLPFGASCLALPLFAYAAARLLPAIPAWLAVAWLACADIAIFYASDGKPYALDLLAAVAAIALLASGRSFAGVGAAVGLAVGGAAMLLVSFGAVFALSGLAVELAWRFRRRPTALSTLAGMAVCWLGALAYAKNLAPNVANIQVQSDATRLLVPSSRAQLKEQLVLLDTPFHLLGLPRAFTAVAAPIAVVGLVSLFRRRRPAAFFSATVIALPFALSAADRYFITYRTVLFLLPVVILLVGAGVGVLARAHRAIAVAAAALLLLSPARSAARHLNAPRTVQDVKGALSLIDSQYRDGDRIAISRAAQYSVALYEVCGCLRFDNLPPLQLAHWNDGVNSPALRSTSHVGIQGERIRLDGGRVWLLVADASPRTAADAIIHGPKALAYQGPGVAVYRSR